MSRYPRRARSAQLKCVSCNAPVVETVDGCYVCVSCGDSPISAADDAVEDGAPEPTAADPAGVLANPTNPTAGRSAEDG